MASGTLVEAPRARGLTGAQWRTIVLASLGGALEFYDFIVYGIFAGAIGAAFFPRTDALIQEIAAFSVFASGYLVRPLGGMMLGALGDRYGRRAIFVSSLAAISGSTVLMGCLPGYATWGLLATALMVLLRLVQGLCLGGELPCAIAYVVETAPERAGFACGVLFFCVNSGVSLAALVSLGLNAWLSPTAAAAYGWRIAFLLGGLSGLLSYLVRRSLAESRDFAAMRAFATRTPLRDLFAAFRAELLVGIAAAAATSAFNGALFAYVPSYMVQQLGLAPRDAALLQTVGLATTSFGLLAVAWLGDRVPRRWFLGTGGLVIAGLAVPFFAALAASGGRDLAPLFILAGLAAALVNGTFAMVLADLFPTRVRFSGVATAYNISQTAFGGTVPLIAASLVAAGRSPGLVVTSFAGLTALASLALRRYGGRVGTPRDAEGRS